MNMRSLLLSLCTCSTLLACSSSTMFTKDNSATFGDNKVNHVADNAQMQTYLAGAQSQLLGLAQQNTNSCIIGQLSIAETLLEKATKEHHGNMNKDAFISLLEFDRQLQKVRCINQYIKGHLGCGYTTKRTVLKHWYNQGEFTQCNNTVNTKAITKVSANNIGKQHTLITETLHDFDQEKIKEIYYPALNQLIGLMKKFPLSTLHISGHADGKGSNNYNFSLSESRAQSVANYFTDQGIDTTKIAIVANGEEKIREQEHDDIARVFNRFTTITLHLDTSNSTSI